MQYWLMKSEPEAYSITMLATDDAGRWDGVRNYQARNFLRSMRVGDRVIFYHSNAKSATGAVGEMEVIREAYPDPTQFDSKSDYVDAKSSKANPRWSAVDVRYVNTSPRCVTLEAMRNVSALQHCRLLARGNRLSVIPLSLREYRAIVTKGRSAK